MFPVPREHIDMTEWLDDFLLRAVFAGLIMVVIAAPMGCLMVWQRLAFFSDTLGHAAVLGVGLVSCYKSNRSSVCSLWRWSSSFR